MAEIYTDLLDRYVDRLNYEIAQKTNPLGFSYIFGQAVKGNVTEKDLAELKGYYSGLKVAREILHRSMCETAEEWLLDEGEGICTTCAFSELCEKAKGQNSEAKKKPLQEHNLVLKQRLKNVTVEILECTKCGYQSVGWFPQDDTEELR